MFLKHDKNGDVVQEGLDIFQNEDYAVMGAYRELRILVRKPMFLSGCCTQTSIATEEKNRQLG